MISFAKKRNKIDIVLITVLLGYFTLTFLRLFNILGILVDFSLGGMLDFYTVLCLIVICLQVEFFFYLKDIKKFYTLPVIVSFYVGFGLTLNSSIVGFLIYELITSVVVLLALVKEGLKNRNGILFCLGIFVAINAIADSLLIYTVQSILRLIALSVLLLGTSGFIDKFLLYDKAEAEKVRNIWISHMVIKEK